MPTCKVGEGVASVDGPPAPAAGVVSQEHVAAIRDPTSHALLARVQRVVVSHPRLGPINTAFVGPRQPDPSRPQVLLLHGFDSSCLEFRRLLPLLEGHVDVYAMDAVGCGFTGSSGLPLLHPTTLGPEERAEHLMAFLEQHVPQPVTVLGASLGGAVAVDFAARYPHAVNGLVLLDAQVMKDGIGMLSSLPQIAARLGVRALRSRWLRRSACDMSCHAQDAAAVEDMTEIGRLHTHAADWEACMLAFMRSGGYHVRGRLAQLAAPSLVLWGRQDRVLPGAKNARQLVEALPGARLVWVEDCGHLAHVEHPDVVASHVLEFVGARAQDARARHAGDDSVPGNGFRAAEGVRGAANGLDRLQ
ncbi:2-hydroxy-6-oxononadienedioate/2-hydroxy-6-oxononatrienedioate hydrolase [Auxenochlorella protothecoides]|uniref:2-hydroxy-6-oxononadienedioate/2-hydroxy-6-oxononatrienedioate hydrolase n=1 Tax=Auxenochlorella protothecoides TaxID=3075 RepID=A0A087SQA1_AUXPR|nr:2-hydroxy-6-oxononadienedioate/2-hydroxy-6-oxononatrienedioate hydrolase [Auxenochlorella protothecoides]KFM27905.1 2-hydroxy-6-oxononadienedioate/2-hydroxy-6-oxononatrienedioate hydrolase [Auxenochlorella protothecoides]RMZ55941.1 hypothetical protein APUTEX25_004365 [Auxenochlorella protothecoides]|eukprot:RMZ55941.1 hypothetical protein APUTEX25_004365 [Auxenochlorella protothecoides]